jgi:hypothetical protein
LAVDHRRPGDTALIELTGLGRVWLGPTWSAVPVPEDGSDSGRLPRRSRLRFWLTNSSADMAEWDYRRPEGRVTRTAVLLRGRRIALLAEQVDATPAGREAATGWRVALPPGVQATPLDHGPGWVLTDGRSGSRARVIPLGLGRPSRTPGRGWCDLLDNALALRQEPAARRCWLPLLVSWDPTRNRQAVRWRTLTVAEKSRVCPPETAFATRVTWGRSETLVIYRSLAPPALRSFLGHQTRARFLIALFGPDGTVEPIVKVD